MNRYAQNIFASVIAAGLLANVTMLFNFSERMARVETKLQMIEQNYLAKK